MATETKKVRCIHTGFSSCKGADCSHNGPHDETTACGQRYCKVIYGKAECREGGGGD